MKVILKNESIHFLFSLVLALSFFTSMSPFLSLLLSFSLGFFIDLDHLLDYGLYLIEKKRKFSFKQFVSGSYFTKCPFFTPLHSWELCVILFIVYFLTINPYVLLAGISLLFHLFIDQLTNNIAPLHGILLYRLYLRNKNH